MKKYYINIAIFTMIGLGFSICFQLVSIYGIEYIRTIGQIVNLLTFISLFIIVVTVLKERK